jgi:hypothetical protein
MHLMGKESPPLVVAINSLLLWVWQCHRKSTNKWSIKVTRNGFSQAPILWKASQRTKVTKLKLRIDQNPSIPTRWLSQILLNSLVLRPLLTQVIRFLREKESVAVVSVTNLKMCSFQLHLQMMQDLRKLIRGNSWEGDQKVHWNYHVFQQPR